MANPTSTTHHLLWHQYGNIVDRTSLVPPTPHACGSEEDVEQRSEHESDV